MTPPRRFYGGSPPGRLEATMLKVLAAEMSDAGRLRRGKQYFVEGAVLDVSIEPSIAEVVVQGSRSSPYDVAITVEPGSGVPGRREVESYCSCPDAERHDYGLCKHGVAAIFAIANEVAIEPELLERWRGDAPSVGIRATIGDGYEGDGDRDDGDEGDGERLAPVTQLFPESTPPRSNSVDRDSVERFNRLLVAPSVAGANPIPELGAVTPIVRRPIGDRLLDGVIDDALDELHLDLD